MEKTCINNKKIAMLITAYKDFDLLSSLISYYSNYYFCYVHIDKKVKLPDYFKVEASKLNNVVIIQKYSVYWGSYRHICAFLELLKLALNDGCEYFHLLPANAFPVKSFDCMDEFYNNNYNKNFIEIIKNEGIVDRINRQKFFYFQHLYSVRSDRGGSFQGKLLKLQRKLKIQRRVVFKYSGYLYCHLSREFAEYVIYYIHDNKRYMRRIRTCCIGEEFFFQNIIMNSPYKDSLVRNSMIYDDWESTGGKEPANLSMKQIEDALLSDKLFARKIDSKEKASYIFKIIT